MANLTNCIVVLTNKVSVVINSISYINKPFFVIIKLYAINLITLIYVFANLLAHKQLL